MIWSRTRGRLQAGEAVLGLFEIAGSGDHLPGQLRWSADGGAVVELLEPRWRMPVNTKQLTVYGVIEESDLITLLAGLVRTTVLDERVRRISAPTLALGEHVGPNDTWQKAIFASANLGEWSGATGLSHSTSGGRSGPPRFGIDWRSPPVQEVSVRGARLKFATDVDQLVGLMPEYSLRTKRRVLVEAHRPARIEALSRRYAMPLLALTAFAADRPDTISEEHYIDPRRQQRIEVWRAGVVIDSPEWRPNALLFYASELPDYRLSILRWCKRSGGRRASGAGGVVMERGWVTARGRP